MAVQIISISIIAGLVIMLAWVIATTKSGKKKEAERQEAIRVAKEKYRADLIAKYGEAIGIKLYKGEYFLDMTPEQLIDSKGRPTDIQKEVMKTKTKVTYIYGNKSSGDVFIFENDLLVRFKDR